MDPYLTVKWIHIISSTVLFGTGIGTAFQMVWAMRSGSGQTVHHVADGVVLADWLFTLPSGLVQPISGFVLIYLAGYSLFEPWLLATYALYLLAFCCWVPVVKLQISIRDDTRSCGPNDAIPDTARRAFQTWFILGWPAFGGLVLVFWLMIAKPELW